MPDFSFVKNNMKDHRQKKDILFQYHKREEMQMLIQDNRKNLFRTDNHGKMILNTFSRDLTYITFNIEYDGFFPENSILSFSAAKYRTTVNEAVNEINLIVKPNKPIHPHIEQITGYTNDFLQANGISQHQAMKRIKAFMSDVDVIIGYNIKADKDFLIYRIPELETLNWFDTLEMLRDFLPSKELKRYNPQLIFELFSIPYQKIGYTQSINQIFQIMLEKYVHHFEEDKIQNLPTPKIFSLYYKVEKNKPRRLYINTNMGQFYFDLSRLVYGLRKSKKISSLCEADMEQLRLKLLKHFSLRDETELYFRLSHESEYAIDLHNPF